MTHRPVDPEGLLPPSGFSHVVVPADGRPVSLAGQTGHRADGSIDPDLVAQFAQAARNVAVVLEAVGGRPEHVVSMTIYVTDLAGYRALLGPIGAAYREVFGRWYPAMTLVGVTELFDPDALVELAATAVVPGP